MKLLIEFDGYEQEQALVGRMLMAYGEFEFDIARLIGYAIEGGPDTAARLFFRVNGEAARLDVADAILRPFFDKMGLGGQWGNTLGALRFCKNIRNQYAHCNWHVDDGKPLMFINMDRDVDSPDGPLNVKLYPTHLRILQRQHEYFEYTLSCLFFLGSSCRHRLGEEAPPSRSSEINPSTAALYSASEAPSSANSRKESISNSRGTINAGAPASGAEAPAALAELYLAPCGVKYIISAHCQERNKNVISAP